MWAGNGICSHIVGMVANGKAKNKQEVIIGDCVAVTKVLEGGTFLKKEPEGNKLLLLIHD